MLKSRPLQLLIRAGKITGITVAAILLLLFLLPVLFPGTVAERVKQFANERLAGKMDFSKVRLSFFSHFPSLTVSLYDFSLGGSAPFQQDTLVAAEEIAFGINLRSLLFDSKVHIDKIFLDAARLQVQVNEEGAANYNVYKSAPADSSSTDTAGTALRLEKISISNSHLLYNDRSVPLLLEARGLQYEGDGDLNKAIFDLNSHIEADALDLRFDGQTYLQNKKLNADLVTRINTHSLSFFFTRNELRINRLPVEFTGALNFLRNGYDIDFTVQSRQSALSDCITALPPAFAQWQEQVKVKGTADIHFRLKGAYIAATGQMPDLGLELKLREGFIQHRNAPVPLSDLFLNLQLALPGTNPDSLRLTVDSLYFKCNQDYLGAVLQLRGLQQPQINGRLRASLNLEQLDQALALPQVDLKGDCRIQLSANGQYRTGMDTTGIRPSLTVMAVPDFKLQAAVNNGYLRFTDLPQAISQIGFKAEVASNGSDYRNTSLRVQDFSATVMDQYIKGNLQLGSLRAMDILADLHARLNLADIGKAYPMNGIGLAGKLQADATLKGIYQPEKNLFPLTVADIRLSDGKIQTPWYPHPVTDIQVEANATNASGNLSGQQLNISRASCLFEGKQLNMQARFNRFDDIEYDVKADGELDLGRIYKVFSKDGLDVSGLINMHLHCKGRQSDAMNGRYSRLFNAGMLEIHDLRTVTEYLPQPFIIQSGQFRFRQDKMWFNRFLARYGETDLRMDGYLQNVPAWLLSKEAVLAGRMELNSRHFNVDEWMVNGAAAGKDTSPAVKQPAASGVLVIPSNLDLDIQARAERVFWKGVQLQQVRGTLGLSGGELQLRDAGFSLLGSETVVNARYAHEGIRRAAFSMDIDARDFDVRRAYDSIRLFRELATAAGSAQGIVSLKYSLKGKLDEHMQPLYPSLEGGGVLSVKEVKVKGFRLFNAVSRTTGKDSIANPDVRKVDIRSRIKNNVITLERFKIKMMGFRLRMEGQTSFDGKLRLRMRLGLPPLGIIGIPMNVSGTQENPRIKLGRGNQEELEETEYEEER